MNRSLHAIALAGLVVVLCGCAQTGGAGGGDRVTESDQTEADRRAHVRLELASGYYTRGQFETALDEVKLALQAQPSLAEAYNMRGLIYQALGDDRLAEESFRRALELRPNDANAMHNYGWFLCQKQRMPEAFVQFQHAVATPRYPGLARSLMAQGVCQARTGDLAAAERSLARSYELDPSSPVTAFNLADVLYRKGDLERARFYIGRVNAVHDHSSAQTLWLAARIEKKAGNAGALRDLGRQLHARFPSASETRLYEQGRFDD